MQSLHQILHMEFFEFARFHFALTHGGEPDSHGMRAHTGIWRRAGLTTLEDLVLCQWGGFDSEDSTFSPLPSDETLSCLTNLTSLRLHVSVSQIFWQNTS
jgi:hypothetical protein